MKLAWLGRLWQYAGIVVATYAATQHSMVWGRSAPEINESDLAASWTHFVVGIFIGVIVFWTGIYLEGRAKLSKSGNSTQN